MHKLKLFWILIAAGVSVLCFFWFSSSRMERPAMNESPVAASDGKATIAVDIPGTASEEIFQVSPDSPDSYPIEDLYALALRQLRAYQADSAQHELMEFIDKEKEKEKASALHRRFEEIRSLLISALQTGNRKVLPMLIKMYLDYPREYDPLEAAAWMEIGKAIYNYSNNQDGVTDYFGMPENEFKRITAILTRQYMALYGLN